MARNLTGEVITLYKTLYYLGREYPGGSLQFHKRLRRAFLQNKNVKDPNEIEALIQRGNFVVKEIEALYRLRKYRTLKQRYYSENSEVTVPLGKEWDKDNK